MKPQKPITDPSFRYVNSASTDISRTFARIRRELRARADREAAERAEADARTAQVQSIFEARRRGKA